MSNVEKRYYDKENNTYLSAEEIKEVARQKDHVENLGEAIMKDIQEPSLVTNNHVKPDVPHVKAVEPEEAREARAGLMPPDSEFSIPKKVNWKYEEEKILADMRKFLASTYQEHYQAKDDLEAFDAWIALGDSGPTFRNTALKYLWRYGKKDGKNKNDLMKAIHYTMMMLYVEHYKDKK